MVENPISWPKKGDKLFKSASDWWHNACLNFPGVGFDLYAVGYKLAGDVLVKHVEKTRSEQDFLVYPVVFLYRQYLELRLKELILYGSKLLESPKKIQTHHFIDKLWKDCREILEKIWPNDSKGELDAIELCIEEFSTIDPTSTSFRYPKSKEGKSSITGLTHINLRNLSEVMERIASLLDGASTGISVYLDQKSEIESWYRE